MNFYQESECTNCGYKFPSHEIIEFEYLLNNTHSILLCKKCASPINELFKQIESLGTRCNNVYDAMQDVRTECDICNKSASKNYYRKKVKRHLVLCQECNNLIEIYLNEVIKQNGKLRNFSIHTNKLNQKVTEILRRNGKK